MKYSVKHRLPSRIRLSCGRYAFTKEQVYNISEYLKNQTGIENCTVSERTGTILINYNNITESTVLKYVDDIELTQFNYLSNSLYTNNISEELTVSLGKKVAFRYLIRPFLPLPVKNVILFYNAFKYIKKAVKKLFMMKIDVEVLDASAICTALIQRSYDTAGSIMFLLSISELIEEWSMKKSKKDLAQGLSLNIDTVWIKTEDCEVQIPISKIKINDVIIVRSGTLIPIDGTITEGEAMVNQATMTGEPLSVKRIVGNTVYAGTVVEDGYIAIKATSTPNDTRLNKIIKLIDNSEIHKSDLQKQTESIADKIVPFSFIGSILTYLFTRSFAKAASILVVDYSCAIKLSGSLSVLSALREAANYKVFVKGGKYLELLSKANTIVFDKTGTLTVAKPVVKEVIGFLGYTSEEVLKISACLEEHFPHSVARAVVKKAEELGINHKEEHSQVEYIIAHGIASKLNNQRVLIGSRHFVFEDENVYADEETLDYIDKKITTESSLYLAIDNKLVGLILIEDPIRESAAGTIKKLKGVGFKNVIMLTGDNENTAKNVAEKLGIDKYKASLLPEQKADYIESLKSNGDIVVMVGDGINDTPSLSAANVGISMKNSSDIAREVSDIALLSDDIENIIALKLLSNSLTKRINNNYLFILSFNTGLLALSLGQLISSGTSALLHNVSTVGIGVSSSGNLLKKSF